MNRFILLVFTCLYYQVKSQTIIMNEVSNGTSGNQEYVEFVVVSNTVTYNCSNTTPPCIDIRGWIFDDNSGLHGGTSGTGVASGAIRFSQSPIWACVPLGTIILIYNDADKNPAIPADDISMADGNCKIVAPISNTSLFESNATTPGAVACSYPSSGWVAGGDWTKTLLANSGDCARIVNLAGCEVFSVCYGTANTNNLIYYAGAGGQKVFYFNDTDPTNQANWTSGSASPSPGAQTPGSPNNSANASYIAQFNNGCMPITPIAIGTATTVNAGCTCDGSAKINPSGSIGPYSYIWYDSNSVPIGQTSATATGLCAGIYKVVSTSHIGCKDSVLVTINSSSTVSVSVNSQTICSGQSAILTATPSAIGGTYLWLPGGATTQTISVSPSSTITYSVTYTLSGCSGTAKSVVSVNSSPIITLLSSSPSICTSGQTVTLSLSGSTGIYEWSNGATTSSISITNAGVYSATVTNSCGSASDFIIINSQETPTVSLSTSSSTICSGQSATITASSNISDFLWNTGSVISTIVVNTPGIKTVSVSNTCGTATASVNITSTVLPVLNLTSTSGTICPNETATLTVTGGSLPYTWSNSSVTGPVVTTSGGTVSVSNTNYCGTSTQTINIIVVNLNANITASPTAGVKPLLVEFTNNSSGGVDYMWDFGNGNSAITQTVSSQTYSVSGSYTVYLNISNGSCSDTDFLIITVLNEEPALIIPNVFTPNNDQVNDVFKVTGFNIVSFNAIIFDRWGLQLFSWNDINKGWDGKVSNRESPDGTYFYIINAKDINDKDIKKQGAFSLFK